MASTFLSEDSPLKTLPTPLSRKQILIIDGLRYSAEMAHIAYQRLSENLQKISGSRREPTAYTRAEALLDAWSIIDIANRFRDLITSLPGLKKEEWTRLLRERTKQVASLRDCVQHQSGEAEKLAQLGAQLWGYLSWVHMYEDGPSGEWFMFAGGTHFTGDRWLFIGPMTVPYRVPPDRVRLNAFGEQVYLWRIVASIAVASKHLESRIKDGKVRLVGEPALDRGGADAFLFGSVSVLYSDVSPLPDDSAAGDKGPN